MLRSFTIWFLSLALLGEPGLAGHCEAGSPSIPGSAYRPSQVRGAVYSTL
jgi:hypothetical protein